MENVPASVGAEMFIALINPAISLVFALAFVALWLHQRRRRGLLVFAGAYSIAAAALLTRYFGLPFGSQVTGLVVSALYVATAVLLAAGTIGPYRRPMPHAALAGFAIAGYCVFAYFLLVEPSVNGRIYAMNIALSGMCLVIAHQLFGLRDRRPVDSVLLGLALLAAFSLVLRTILIAATGPTPDDAKGFFSSIFWTSLNLSWAILSVLVGLAVLARAALDTLDDLRDQSEADGLTGLPNRRGFEQAAAALLSQDSRPHVLIIADLDGMTAVNDVYGRSSGDAVIAGFARLLAKSAGPGAVCGRIGGDEFGVLLSASTVASARALAEGVRLRFGRAAAPGLPGGVATVTASFGVAGHAEGETYGELQRRCDAALFEAKRSGRDRVVMARSREAQWVDPAAHDQPIAAVRTAWPPARKRERRA